MRWIELNNVEYGECIVLGGQDRTILMVDCGSMSQTVREGDMPLNAWYEAIADRHQDALDRFFLLTHYHRDHLSGFLHLLDARPNWFNRVYLPKPPLNRRGVPLLLEYALFAYLFLPPQTDCAQVNTACVKIFRTLERKLSGDRVFTLGSGDVFSFDDVDYEVLWPRVENFPFSQEMEEPLENMNIRLSSPFQPACVQRFLRVKKEFLSRYVECCQAFSATARALPEIRRACLEELAETLEELEHLKEELNLSPAASDIREILENPLNTAAYSDCVNAASLVFQNVRVGSPSAQDILMTGDVTPSSLLELEDRLYDGYFILKAPHHGTASGYCSLFSDMSAAHILISNGEYHAGGAIAQKYVDREDSLRHCSNPDACKWFQASGGCCNRLYICYDQEAGSGLALKCPAASGKGKAEPGCLIRVASPKGLRGCLCDSGVLTYKEE